MSIRKYIGKGINARVAEIYASVTNTELNEGSGDLVDDSYHWNRASAVLASDGIGVMGSDGDVESRLVIAIDDGSKEEYFIIGDEKPITVQNVRDSKSLEKVKAVRENALKKLSSAERVALGLE